MITVTSPELAQSYSAHARSSGRCRHSRSSSGTRGGWVMRGRRLRLLQRGALGGAARALDLARLGAPVELRLDLRARALDHDGLLRRAALDRALDLAPRRARGLAVDRHDRVVDLPALCGGDPALG